MSHQSNIIKTEFGMLCSQGYYTSHIRRYFKNYYSYVHLIIIYGIIFWGNLPHNTDTFKVQKQIIWIMKKSGSRDSCRQLFKRLEILLLQSQYIFSVLLFVVKNKDLYSTNQEIHNINTRSNINLHLPVCNLTLFQKGAYFSGIKLFNP